MRNGRKAQRCDPREGGRVSDFTAGPLGYASPSLVDLDAGAPVVLLSPWGADPLQALDPRTQALRWSVPLPTGSWNPPLVARDGGGTRLALHLLSGELVVLDAATRALRWTRPFGQLAYVAPTATDLDGDGALELLVSEVGEPGDLVALRLADGAELWRRAGLGGRSSPVAVTALDGEPWLLHTSNGQGVFALDRHGATRWQWRPLPRARTQPYSDAGGLVTDLDGDGALELVTALRDGVVYVLDVRTGALRWRYRTGEARVEAPPVAADVDGDGVQELVVAGYDRALSVLRTPARRARAP